MTKDKFVAAMVLAGVGDAMGYKSGDWEFNFVGEDIHKAVKKHGGVNKLKVKLPDFPVSDDTILLLSTSESLVDAGKKNIVEVSSYYVALYKELCFRYKKDVLNDMAGRSPGLGTMTAVQKLFPRRDHGWHIPFNNRGGGCGAAMRAMAIGLRYPNIFDVDCFEHLTRTSVESGRMTHNHPTGYLGSFASALFAAFALNHVPIERWGNMLMQSLPCVLRYVEKVGRDVIENTSEWGYFTKQWTNYLESRDITNGTNAPRFPAQYEVKERDEFYKSVSYSGWGGSSGHDAPLIAYDALMAAGGDWVKLCHHAMLHGGDNDSTGVISGFWYGAMYGMEGVNKNNHHKVEKRDRLEKSGKELFALAKPYLEMEKPSMEDNTVFAAMLEKSFNENSFIYP